MKISVLVKSNAREDVVERIDESHFMVRVTAPPQEGKANRAVIRALADYFNIAPSTIMIVSGLTSKNKIVDIESYTPNPFKSNPFSD